jgi:hypothetical protein
MTLHSSGLFCAVLRWPTKSVLEVTLSHTCGRFARPPCPAKNRSLSVLKLILLEALSQIGILKND